MSPQGLIRAVLISPPLMWLKARGRDAMWRVRGRRLTNPPWPPHVTSMLFVCYGNICRSPFAARLARRLLHDQGITGVRCYSAGFRTSQRAASPPDAVATAATYRVNLSDHRPALLTPELLSASDVVFVMEPEHMEAIRARFRIDRKRLFLLPLLDASGANLGAYERCHIADPFGKGRAEFERCYARIASVLDVLVRCFPEPVAARDRVTGVRR